MNGDEVDEAIVTTVNSRADSGSEGMVVVVFASVKAGTLAAATLHGCKYLAEMKRHQRDVIPIMSVMPP
jgi:hypothetical protein